MMASKSATAIVAACVCALSIVASCPNAQAEGEETEDDAGFPPGEQVSSLPYEQLLVKYLAHIDQMARPRERREIEFWRETLERFVKIDQRLRGTESQVLEKLRAEHKRRGRKLFDCEGAMYECSVVVPTSATSARIFAALHKEDAVDACSLVGLLSAAAPHLCREWIELVESMVARAEVGSRLWRSGTYALYRAGASRDKHRSALVRMVTDDSDVRALEALFFDVEKQTGRSLRVVTQENLLLLRKLVEGQSHPEVRLTCASYAAAIRDYDLAQAICIDLLSRPYKGWQNTNARPPEEDYPLARARQRAMFLMFYRLRNERMFRLIYDRSRVVHREQAKLARLMIDQQAEKLRGRKPTRTDEVRATSDSAWLRFDSFRLGRMEVDFAQSLISEVERCEGQ